MDRRTAILALPAAAIAAPAMAFEDDPAITACQAWHDAAQAADAAWDRLDESDVPDWPSVTLRETVKWVSPRSEDKLNRTFSVPGSLDHDNWAALFGRQQFEEGRATLNRLHAERDAAIKAARDKAGIDATSDALNAAKAEAIDTRATTMAGVRAKADAAALAVESEDGPLFLDDDDARRMLASIANDLRALSA